MTTKILSLDLSFFSQFFLIFFLYAIPSFSFSQELLINRSFELPVVTTNGNNLGVTVPNWSFNFPTNIVKPFSGYAPSGPNQPPVGGGNQYYDSNSSGAIENLNQSFTLSQNGMVDFSAWFSVRDSRQAAIGKVAILNPGGATVASASISFTATDALGIWRKAEFLKQPLLAGTYSFVITLVDSLNTDLASVFFYPAMTITKTVAVFSDPITGTVNPHAIPNAFVDYTVVVRNPATYTVTPNTVIVSDATPVNLSLFVGNLSGSGPVNFLNGSPSSGLNYSFVSLSNLSDTLDFSNNGGATWTYTPVANATGVDSNVTNFRVKPTGTMAANSSFSLKFRYQIK